jgi:hypothetical protein
MIRSIFILLLAFTPLSQLPAQQLSSVRTRWNDSFVAWDIFAASADSSAIADAKDAGEAPPEDQLGELKLRWLNVREDWTEWEFEYGDYRGTIKMKWKDDPNQWELRCFDGTIISMRTMWTDDITEWRITDNDITLEFKSRWKNQLNEWETDSKEYGYFGVQQIYRGDPRDWAVDDYFNEQIPVPMRIAMMFTAIFNSSPRQ